MDTIYAEGQRRYVESLSAYARQFVGQMQKPEVEHIEGLSPAIAIEQKNLGHTPRSTVGTVTEIYDYLRILLARLGQPYCPDCDIPVGTQTADEIVDKIMAEPAGTKLYLMAPRRSRGRRAVRNAVGRASRRAATRACGSTAQTHSLDDAADDRPPPQAQGRSRRSTASRSSREARSRIADSVENALALGKGVLHVAYRERRRCPSRSGDVTSTASISPATSAAAASSRSRRTTFRSTARSAGARRAKGWARRPARTRRRCCAIRS